MLFCRSEGNYLPLHLPRKRLSSTDFLCWCHSSGAANFTKATLQEYRSSLESGGLSASTINVRICAIRKLATELADNGALPQDVAAAIGRVKGAKRKGVRIGNWLSASQAEDLLLLPDAGSVKGKRDHALLGILVGAGLRRSEAAGLTFAHIQQRDGRWIIADLVGKQRPHSFGPSAGVGKGRN